MLRITVEQRADAATLRLEGKLTGEWVRELERCWISSRNAEQKARPTIDLSGVSFVDERGRALLESMVAQGAELVARNPMMASLAHTIVEQVKKPVLAVSEQNTMTTTSK